MKHDVSGSSVRDPFLGVLFVTFSGVNLRDPQFGVMKKKVTKWKKHLSILFDSGFLGPCRSTPENQWDFVKVVFRE